MNKAGAHISAGDRRSAVKRKSMTYDINSSRGGGGGSSSNNNKSRREQTHVVREERKRQRDKGCKGARKRQAGKARQGRHFVVLKRWKMLALSALPNRDTHTQTRAHTLSQNTKAMR